MPWVTSANEPTMNALATRLSDAREVTCPPCFEQARDHVTDSSLEMFGRRFVEPGG